VVAHTAVASPSDRNEDGRCAYLVRIQPSALACPLSSRPAAKPPITTRRSGIAQERETPLRQRNELNRMRGSANDSPVEGELRPGHLMRAKRELSRRKINLLRDLSIRSPRPTLCMSALRKVIRNQPRRSMAHACGVTTTENVGVLLRTPMWLLALGLRRRVFARRFQPGDSHRFSKVWNFESQAILIMGFLRSND